jgi:hypothetical protein
MSRPRRSDLRRRSLRSPHKFCSLSYETAIASRFPVEQRPLSYGRNPLILGIRPHNVERFCLRWIIGNQVSGLLIPKLIHRRQPILRAICAL